MAYCPECKAEMSAMATQCPNCNHSFPTHAPTRVDPFAYGKLANVALMFGMIAAALGCIVILIGAISAVLDSRFAEVIVGAPIAFLICLANLVVFMRVSDLKAPTD